MSCLGEPLPIMFVPREVDHAFIGNFMKKKYSALSQSIGMSDTTSVYCPKDQFKRLIDLLAAAGDNVSGVKVYFGSWCSSNIPEVSQIIREGYGDLTTLIFVPMDAAQNDILQYFVVSPLDGSPIPIPRNLADIMVKTFKANKASLLEALAKAEGKSNFVESTSIWYDMQGFNGPAGLIKEMDCQPADGISIFLGAFPIGQTYPTDAGDVNIGWQLTLIFVLARTLTHNGVDYIYHFDLEDSAGFKPRQDASASGGFGGGDTGNPCPPAKNCQSSVG